MTAKKPRPLSPHIQVYNMFKITSLTSILHRITGCALVLGSVIVVWWLMAIAHGPEAYGRAYRVFGNCFFQLILVGFSWAFWYHLINGFRHLTWDTGAGFSKKVYPVTGKLVFLGSFIMTALMWACIWSF